MTSIELARYRKRQRAKAKKPRRDDAHEMERDEEVSEDE